MSMLRAICAVTLATALSAHHAHAQFEPPKPGPEHAYLKRMEGTWDTTMSMAGQESKGSAVFKMDLGGLWLASTFEGSVMGQKFTGRGYDTYDPAKKKFVSIWLDSMSTTPMMMEGTYDEAKKTLTMIGDAPGMDGKMTKHKAVSTMPDDNTIKFAMYMGDTKEPAFTIVYKRKK
jgi:hypothetical protein